MTPKQIRDAGAWLAHCHQNPQPWPDDAGRRPPLARELAGQHAAAFVAELVGELYKDGLATPWSLETLEELGALLVKYRLSPGYWREDQS